MRNVIFLVCAVALAGCGFIDNLLPWGGHDDTAGVTKRPVTPKMPETDWMSGNPETVKKVQTGLKNKGYYKGPVNGKITDDTKKALAAFQKDRHEMRTDGTLDNITFYDVIE
jgi:hypothetical protein